MFEYKAVPKNMEQMERFIQKVKDQFSQTNRTLDFLNEPQLKWSEVLKYLGYEDMGG